MKIRKIQPQDADATLELVSRCLNTASVPRTKEFWSWKHVDNFFGPSPGLVAEEAGRLVGLRMFLRWKWAAGSESHEAVRAVDTLTAPEARGKGIFKALTLGLAEEMMHDGVSFIFNTPNPASRPGYLKMGWRDVARIPVLFRPIRPASILLAISAPRPDSGDGVDWRAPSDAIEPERIVHLAGVEGILSDAYDGETRLHTKRTAAYLTWRYSRKSGLIYWVQACLEKDAGALVVFRQRRRRGMKELTITELLLSRGTEGVRCGSSLVRQLIDNSGADYAVASAVRQTVERTTLLKSGFFPWSIPGPRLTVRTLGADVQPDPSAWSSWRPSIGDLELF